MGGGRHGRLYLAKVQTRSRIDALRTLLVLHAFRFIGLSFLVPGVVSPNLPLAGDRSRRNRRNSPANDWIDAIDPSGRPTCTIVGELARAALPTRTTPSVCHFSEVYSSSTPCGVTRITALEWEACKSGVRR